MGNVLIFLPQIVILFGFIAVLEDCGYMARAAFLMDKLMSRCGLSGRSFIPLLSSFACAIPGVMATRTIEDRRDRLATILVAPLMSCSARLPVYILLIGTFIPATTILGIWNLQGLVLFSMYLIGLVLAPLVAWSLKKTVLRGDAPVFLMELPSYKFPSLRTIVDRMVDRGWAFCKRAGTLILATTVVIWALQYYPRPASVRESFAAELAKLETAAALPEADQMSIEAEKTALANRIEGAYQAQSILGRIGRAIEPVVEPLGWDWRIGMAAVAAFPAREVVVSALGTIYSVGADTDEESVDLRDALRKATWPDGRPVFTPVVALSLMVFFALCCQCGATLAVIRRETNSWRWPIFTFFYMTGLAYVGALAVYQIGARLS
ncbi:MAG: ferrous iron transporter B [Planctomycetota bacterium]